MSVRWAVIGAGKIAERRMIPEGILAAPETELVALMRRDETEARRLGTKFECTAYTNEDELLARKDVDIVYIASPTSCHHSQTLKALAAGKHVLCEKPVAMSAAEAEEMTRAAREAGRTLGIGFMMRFHPVHRWIEELILHGTFGQTISARAQFSCWYPDVPNAWRQIRNLGGGGVTADMAVHAVDLLGMFLGDVVSVSARMATLTHDYEVEDSAVITLEFQAGAIASITSHFNLPDGLSKSSLEILGTKASLTATGTMGQTADGSVEVRAIGPGTAIRDLRFEGIRNNIYRLQVEDLNRAVLERRAPKSSALDGLKSQRVLDAAYESARTGRTIRLVTSS